MYMLYDKNTDELYGMCRDLTAHFNSYPKTIESTRVMIDGENYDYSHVIESILKMNQS